MCGIAGILNFRGQADPSVVKRMIAVQKHRGPDGEGFLHRGPVALGHCRLSVIDLVHGAQPMQQDEGRFAITYNGEVYNFRELRTELEAEGLQFETDSDTEVVLAAYRTWGEDAVKRFRGMFALAIVDFLNETVFLARDSFGIKPLVYARDGDQFVFASELRGLVQGFSSTPRGRQQSLVSYLKFGYIPSPHTIYHDVYKLPPGHAVSVSFMGETSGPAAFRVPEFGDEETGVDPEEWLARLDAALRESVRAHLIADVPVGVFLSGGIDSSLIAAYAAEESTKPLTAFNVGFADADFDESPYARDIAGRLGIRLEQVELPPLGNQDLLDTLSQHDEPFGDSSALPTGLVCKAARQQFPVVLSGDGGDELFGGYARYEWWMDDVSARDAAVAWWREQGKWLKLLRHGIRNQRERRHPRQIGIFSDQFSEDLRETLLGESGKQLQFAPDMREIMLQKSCRRFEPLRQFMAYDLSTYLPGDILRKVDVASMSVGLEARPPLLDMQLFQTIRSMPVSSLYDPHAESGERGKKILRRLMAQRFGNDHGERRKKGFSVPLAEGFSKGGVLRAHLQEVMASENFRSVIHVPCVEQQLDQEDRQATSGHRLWCLLALGQWMQNHPKVQFS